MLLLIRDDVTQLIQMLNHDHVKVLKMQQSVLQWLVCSSSSTIWGMPTGRVRVSIKSHNREAAQSLSISMLRACGSARIMQPSGEQIAWQSNPATVRCSGSQLHFVVHLISVYVTRVAIPSSQPCTFISFYFISPCWLSSSLSPVFLPVSARATIYDGIFLSSTLRCFDGVTRQSAQSDDGIKNVLCGCVWRFFRSKLVQK